MIEGTVLAAAKLVADLLIQEASFLGRVEDKLKELLTELQFAQSFLKDADSKRSESQTVCQCLVEIRDICYDIEDILEFYTLKIASKRKEGCGNATKRYACILREGKLLHKVRSQVDRVANKISQSTRRLQTAGIRQLGDPGEASARNRQEQRRSYPHLDNNVVGSKDKIEELVSVLTNNGGHQHQFISICGMGGVGKTTLAKKVYKHHQIRNSFDGFAWVFVSQQFEKEIVWEAILSSLGVIKVDHRDNIFRRKDTQELAERLHTYLRENKCLVVLDDVWSTQAWDILQPGFPNQATTSKILLTSRNTEVASHTASYLHALECLDDNQSWELFHKIAFPIHISNNSRGIIGDHSRMEELGKKMVKYCAGLPLAITVLGGILVTKCGLPEWQMVHNDVKSYIRGGEGYKVQDILSLSYESLPAYLKPCFLYFANFPEDYEIPIPMLIHTWIAEGFVTHSTENREETMEDIAEGYLLDLLQRCMIEMGKQDDRSSKIKTCRMHDLMRDFCLFQAEEEKFISVIDTIHKDSFAASITSARRLATTDMKYYTWMTGIRNSNLRSFFYFYGAGRGNHYDLFPGRPLTQKAANYVTSFDEIDSFKKLLVSGFLALSLLQIAKKSIANFFKSFKKLRVLHTEALVLVLHGSGGINKIGHLIHLRYLSLAKASISTLPSTLGKLTCLQTLDLRVNTAEFSVDVPNVLWKLEQLRHLYLPENCSSRTKLRLANLCNLQTLVNFPTNNCVIDDLCTLTSLRELHMLGALAPTDQDCILNCVVKSCCCGCEPAPDDNDGYVGLEQNPIPMLEKLPKLRILALKRGAFIGNCISFSSKGFPLLEYLIFDRLPELVELRVEEGAMPALKYFHHQDCKKLTAVPQQLSSLCN